jgi:hypothetical protein
MLTHVAALGGRGCAVADLDRDDDLDLVLTNHYNGSTGLVDSRILWGAPAMPFDPARSSTFPTSWASRASIADLDGNGWLDVAVPQAYNGSSYTTSSRVYYRDATGTTFTEFFPTIGGYDVELLDWNGDDRIDLLWGSYYDGTRYRLENRLYAGGRPRPVPSGPVVFPSAGTLGLRAHDLGHTWDRGWVERFTSRPLDVGDGHAASWLDVSATVPAGTTLRIQLRSAADEAGLSTAAWQGPTGPADAYTTWPIRVSGAHAGHRFLQYRAEFEMRNAADSPVLDRVALHWLSSS